MGEVRMKLLPPVADIDNIIFDFGGVLFDIDYDAPVRAFAALGLNDFNSLYTKAAQNPLFDLLETGKISNEGFYDEIRTHFKTQLDSSTLEAAWNSILTGIPKGRIDLIHQLKTKKRTFLLSNTNAIHVAEFERMIDREMGLAYYRSAFEKVHYSNEIGIKKPDPKTFLALCEWHDLKPERTLFIDDSPQHVKGALAAGLIAYHLDVNNEDVRDLFAGW